MKDSADYVGAERVVISRAALFERLVRTRLTSRDCATERVEPGATTDHDIAVTPLQRSLWLHGERYGHGPRQLLTWGACLTGQIDDEVLVAGLRFAADDPALRVIFPVLNGDITCRAVVRSAPVLFIDRSRELAGLSKTDRVAAGRCVIAESADEVDIAQNVLALTCIRIDGDTVLLGLVAHHLVFDGRSLRLFLDRLEIGYREPHLKLPRADRGPSPHALRCSAAEKSTSYWAAVLADCPPGLMSAGHLESGRGGRSDVAIGATTARGLRQLAANRHATLFMVVFACVAIALRRAGAPSDVVIGVPVDTRRPEDVGSYGYFVNTLPFRLAWDDERTTFDTILTKSRSVITEGLTHRDAALADIAASLRVSRDAKARIFEVVLNFLGVTDDALHLDGVSCEPFDLEVGQPEFGMTITVRDDGSGLDIVLEYAHRFLDADAAAVLGKLLNDVVSEICEDPDTTIGTGTIAEVFQISVETSATGPVQELEADAPVRHLQTQVAEVFREVCGASHPLTPHDDFFLLGGYSLHATQVARELSLRTGVDLTLADVFDNSTVGELAALISARVQR